MMKKLLVLLVLSALSDSVFATRMVQDPSYNVYTLATTDQCSGCDLTDLNSSELASGAAITVQGSPTNLPTRTSALAITNLSGATLIGATFNCAQDGVSLVNTNFSSANLQNATFNGCNLTGANFQNATLTGVTFAGNSILNNADFSGTATNLSGASLSNIQAVGANFTNVPMYGANLSCSNFSSARFSGAGLSGTTISCPGQIICTNGACTNTTNFTGALFYDPATGNGLEQSIRQQSITKNSSGQYVINISTTPLNLQGMKLSNVDFNVANMVGIDLSQTTISGCVFGNGTNLNNANLTGSTISNSDFIRSNLNSTNLTNANFSSNVDLTSATLNGATINKTDFTSSILNNAQIRGVSISNSYFNNAKLQNVTLTASTINTTVFDGADFTGATILIGTLSGDSSLQNVTLNQSAGWVVNQNTNGFAKVTGTQITNSLYPFSVISNLLWSPYNTLPTSPINSFPLEYIFQPSGTTIRQVAPAEVSTGPCNEGGGRRCTFNIPAKNDSLTLSFTTIWNSSNITTSNFCSLATDVGSSVNACQSLIYTATTSGVVQASNEQPNNY